MKEVLVSDIIKAMEENGFEWSKGSLFTYVEDTPMFQSRIRGGCIIGQAALNLNLDGSDLQYQLSVGLPSLKSSKKRGEAIYQYNDGPAISYKDALTYAKRILNPVKNKSIIVHETVYDNFIRKVKD